MLNQIRDYKSLNNKELLLEIDKKIKEEEKIKQEIYQKLIEASNLEAEYKEILNDYKEIMNILKFRGVVKL
jgi:Tfp pilus assembly protein PilO